jgi:hypothetical protein
MVRLSSNTTHALVIAALLSSLTGCSAFRNTVPGYCVGDGYQESRSDKEPINFLRLRREPPPAYRLDSRDVLGIYIEGVLGNRDEPPPVHFPEEGYDIPPAIGYPVPIREDGTVSLPLIEPLSLKGLTLAGAEQKIRDAYIGKKILKPARERIIVTLMRPRTYHILVVREDSTTGLGSNLNFGGNPQNIGLQLALGQQRPGQSYPVELRAYQNDVLHALSETGGLPGSDARNEVIILRGAFSSDVERDSYMTSLNDPAEYERMIARPNVIKIPLRLGPDDPVIQLSEEDITLNTGDIVFVRSRETEVFYTGGLLPAGQWPLPRDYDIDVLQAIALAGGNISASVGTGDDGFMRSGGIGPIFPPTRLIVVRELCDEQVPIEVDLRRAMIDPGEKIRILPGDFITLEYTPLELAGNIALGLIRFNVFLGSR